MASSSTSPGERSSRRARGTPLSCAECRRLKLRCSRVFPCASCVKKGCAAICPEGSLTTGRGNRFVLANTEVLHEKIGTLCSRVRDLEDALAEAHRARSHEAHPLLTPELLQLKRPLEREAPEAPKELEADTNEAIDAVGSLSISETGHTKFYGPTANAWYLLQNEEGGDDETENPEINLPSDLPWLGHSFPFATVSETKDIVRRDLYASLPDHDRAIRLTNIYFQHCAWMYTPIPEQEFHTTVLSRIYDHFIVAADQDPIDSHRLAVVYMVFALGTLFDLEKPYLSVEATQFYQAARAALSLDSVLEHQSIPAIQALVLMCHFMFMSFRDAPRWALMGLVVKLTQGLGLHRDGGKWNLSAEEAYRRRSLMWEVYTYDAWQSLTFGRPPSFSNAFIDCQMPDPDPQPSLNSTEEVEMSYCAWKHRFASRCMSYVQEQAFGARTPSYKTIQELHKKVHNFYIPPSLRVPGFGGAKAAERDPPIELTMQRHTVFSIKEITVFYLHRGFFARAIEDNPEDPLGSKFAPSVLAAYTSASTFVALVKSLHSQHPKITERLWFLFTHVFSCSIVLGSIAAKCPGMPFARSALMTLDSAYSLFEVVKENDRAARVLPVLQKLKQRAFTALNSRPAELRDSPSRMSPGEGHVKEEDDELAALGGKTRLVPRKSPSVPSSPDTTTGAHGLPSPQGSQSFSPTVPLAHDGSLSRNGSGHGMVPWNSYQQPHHHHSHPSPQLPQVQADDYSNYYSSQMSPWTPEAEYSLQAQPMAMSPHAMTYMPYDQMAATTSSYLPSQSPVDTHNGGVQLDPNASWQNLYAQYGAPGMS